MPFRAITRTSLIFRRPLFVIFWFLTPLLGRQSGFLKEEDQIKQFF